MKEKIRICKDEKEFERAVFWAFLFSPQKKREFIEHERDHYNKFLTLGYSQPLYFLIKNGFFTKGFGVTHKEINEIPKEHMRQIYLAPKNPSKHDYEKVFEIDLKKGLHKFLKNFQEERVK